MPTNADLGVALRRLCRNRKRTIEDVAFAADVHPTYLSGIERGVRNPTWAKLCALAAALGVSIASLAQCAESEAYVANRVREARRELDAQVERGGETAEEEP
jgi:transcriptional regulator with XRE-family HTH domain